MNIKIDGLEELRETIGTLRTLQGLRDPMRQSVFQIQRDMADAPARKGDSPAQFVSAKQRRYFFWALNSGAIRVPYRRTGTLGRRWTTDVALHGNALIGRIGNNTSYGPLVQSARFQARRFRNIWQTDEQVLRRNETTIIEFFERAVDRLLRD